MMRSLPGVLLMLVVAVAGCDFAPGTETDAPRPAEIAAPPPVSSDRIECSGVVRGGRAWSLVLGPGERVRSVPVSKGRTLAQGDELLLLDKPELRKLLLDATERLSKLEGGSDERKLIQLRIRQQRSVIDDWSRRIEKERALAKEIPEYPVGPKVEALGREKEKAEAACEILELELIVLENGMKRDEALADHWRRTVDFVKTEREALRILAPRRVRVVGVHPLPQRAVAGENILDLVDDEPVHVLAEVPQHQIPLVRAGQRVEILTDDSGRSPAVGEVEAILPLREPTGGRYPRFPVRVRVPFSKLHGKLIAGMRVTVLVSTSGKDDPAE